MAAPRQILRAHIASYVQRNRRTLAKDPAIIAALHAEGAIGPAGAPDDKVLNDLQPLYADLGGAEAATLARATVSLLRKHELPEIREIAKEVLLHLACLTDGALRGVHVDLVELGVVYPGVLFRGAGPRARDLLVEQVEKNPNHILQCLAWVADEEVGRRFKAWADDPPGWTGDLYWLSEYTLCAGWELSSPTDRRRLYSDRGQRLAAAPPGTGSAGFQTFLARHDLCPWCHDRLNTILALNLSTPDFAFLGLPGGQLTIPTCIRCSVFGTVLSDVDFRGNGKWSARNRKPDYLDTQSAWKPVPPSRLVPGAWMRTECEGELIFGGSRLGGLPFWDQDPEYPVCPGCERHMPFLAQLDMADIEEIGEGNYYVFLCRDCGVAATGYQHT